MDKNIIRNKCKEIRKNLDVCDFSSKIIKIIREWQIYKCSSNIMLFYPLKQELNFLSLLELDSSNKNFYFPAMADDEISVVTYCSDLGFKCGKYGIKEPCGDVTCSSNLDLIIVPALAADSKGNRIGYGKGCYDKFLTEIKKNKNKPVTVVPVCSCFFYDCLPHESHDVFCDYVLTENEIIKSSQILSD